nr:hypothetical protein XLIUZIGB_XLIUZIGB_CDS_0046 [Caudoviricetes sp.]
MIMNIFQSFWKIFMYPRHLLPHLLALLEFHYFPMIG